MKSKMLVMLTCLITLQGCASLTSWGRVSAESYKTGSTGRVFVWSPEYSAGVGRDNAMCVQGALTASATSVAAKIDVIKKAKGSLSTAESIAILNPASTQTTFANTAYFAICQLALNPQLQLTNEDVKHLYTVATLASLKVDPNATSSQEIASPDVIQRLLTLFEEKSESNEDVTVDDISNAIAGEKEEEATAGQ